MVCSHSVPKTQILVIMDTQEDLLTLNFTLDSSDFFEQVNLRLTCHLWFYLYCFYIITKKFFKEPFLK